ncbi:MAG: extracellular solute-binding protein [Chloroflexi bacterium]|nr:extracellular solute-binding protein [Chloroflexota bacterium]MBP8056648.1 extracellular solute-binding protein [Chloroflexota bacterium]
MLFTHSRGQSSRARLWLGLWLLGLTLLPPTTTQATRPAHRAPDVTAAPHLLLRQNGSGPALEIRADTLGLPLAETGIAAAYPKPSVFLAEGDTVEFVVTIEEAGEYTVAWDVAAADSFLNAPEAQLLIDGAFPTPDTQRIILPVFYENSADEFPLDRYGNEALIRQQRLLLWATTPLRDANFSQPYPLQLTLGQGQHTFTFTVSKEALYLGSIYLKPFAPYPDYNQYLQNHPASATSGVFIELEAEFPSYKNNTSVRPASSRSLEVTPYDTYKLLLNTLGGESWKHSGSAVYYEVEAPADGYYFITLRAIQNTRNNFTVFRRVTVNGELPFAELNAIPFAYSTDWADVTLGGDTPYQIYLHQGTNVIGIEATNSPYYAAIEKIRKVLIDINTLSLEIKKLTGNQVDPFKEWVLSDYIPDIEEQLLAIAADLETDLDGLNAINESGGSQEIMTYQMAIDNIRFLAQDPDEIPVHMTRFSDGSGSAAQLLGTVLPLLQSQPLALDKIYIHSADTLPEPVKASALMSFWEGLKRFLNSFKRDPYQTIGADEDEIEVWVNRSRQYVDLMQRLADERFTPESGIRVKFSLMPDEGKLVLANAAGIQPDVALGVSTNVPYELAIRNALTDLRSFEDFDSYIRIYSPGALLSYIINDSAYAIPETQDFWVTYYRRDILESLDIPVPHTWNDVIEILPELQRYGMNFNTALSSGPGGKGYLATAPYLFNYGAELYSENGFATGLASDEAISAVQFMAESFTIYGMPLTTASFYDSFRYGSLPIGIANFEPYIKLMTAAPELNGLWSIDLYPATVLPDGTQNRYATGSAQAGIMFASTDKPDESWEFMKWWMSTETQIDFQEQLILNYGLEYLWNSANLEAFQYLAIPEEHKAVILEQWQWLQEPVKLPGSYMQERELSNAWNKIVFDGVNPRVAIDNSIIIINREITRKMEEFGYLENGVIVKEFRIPTIETVESWMARDE